jgi:hypothetical protein
VCVQEKDEDANDSFNRYSVNAEDSNDSFNSYFLEFQLGSDE